MHELCNYSPSLFIIQECIHTHFTYILHVCMTILRLKRWEDGKDINYFFLCLRINLSPDQERT